MKILDHRITLLLLLLAGFLVVSPASGQGWAHYSLPGGTLTNLTWNPHDTTEILGYHAEDHKLFRSSDGGHTWQATCEGLPPDPYNNPHLRYLDATPDTLYFIETYRLFRSVDGGETWCSILPVGTQQLTNVEVAESRPSRLITHCWSNSGSPWIASENYGSSWHPIETPHGVSILRIDPFDADHWIALDGDQLIETTNAGEFWSPYGWSRDEEFDSMIDLQFDPARQGTVYTFSQNPDGTRSLWRNAPTQNPDYELLFAADEFAIDRSGTLTARVYNTTLQGDTSSFVSFDGGLSWNEAALWAPYHGHQGRHPIRSTRLTPNPLNPQTLFVSTPSNLFLSRDGGNSMEFVASGISEPEVRRICASNPISHVITSNGQLWKLDHGDPTHCVLLWNFVEDVWVGGGWGRTLLATGLGLRLSLDSGETWEQVLPTAYINDTHSVTMTGQPPRIMVDVYGRLNMSINYGQTWTQSADPILPGNIRLVPGGVHGLLAIRGSEIYQTPDYGLSWEFYGDTGVDIAEVEATTLAEMLYLRDNDGRIYLYNNATGEVIELPVPESFGPVHSIATRHTGNPFLYIATDAGVYASENTGQNWIALEGPYQGEVSAIDFYSSQTIFIGTRKNGSWIGHDIDFVSVEDDPSNHLPSTITLHPAWPNPFNASTRIAYELPRAGMVRIGVYDLLGRRVALLDQGVRQQGHHELMWHADAASGTYIVRLHSNDMDQTQKVILVR